MVAGSLGGAGRRMLTGAAGTVSRRAALLIRRALIGAGDRLRTAGPQAEHQKCSTGARAIANSRHSYVPVSKAGNAMRPPSGEVPRVDHTAAVNNGCRSRNSLRPNKFHRDGMLALDPHLPLLLRTDGSVQIGMGSRAGGSWASARCAVGVVLGGHLEVPTNKLIGFFATGLDAWSAGTGRLHLDFHCVVKFLEGSCESAA